MNPLLTLDYKKHQIDFSSIKSEHFKEALEILLPKIIKEHEIASNEADLTFKELFENQPHSERMNILHTILYHLNSVVSSPEYQETFEAFDEKLSEVYTKFSLDERIYYKLCAYTNTKDFASQHELNRQMVFDTLTSMEESGINLPDEEKEKLYKNATETSNLCSTFNSNLMQSQAESHLLFTEEQLDGLPTRSLNVLHTCESTEENSVKTYKVPYSKGIYGDIMTYCHSEETRKVCYEEGLKIGVTGELDNSQIIKNIADKYQEKSKIMGFDNYSAMTMRKNMAKNADNAISFIDNIAHKALPFAKQEQQIIINYGQKVLGRNMKVWDYGYVKNIYANELFQFEPEEVRKYFTVTHLMNGFFDIFSTLYKIKFTPIDNETLWNPDVKAFTVTGENDTPMGKIYFDLYLREQKQQGAWMMSCIDRELSSDGELTLPVVYVVCNAPKDAGQEPTLSFDEVNTFFHEMGHAFHQLLTKINFSHYSGLNNVQKDAIELPSQFMENFIYDYEVIKKITCHSETKEHMPEALFKKLLNSKNFNSALHLVRQCIFAKMDLLIFSNPGADPIEVEKEVKELWETAPTLKSEKLISPNFSHIFGGGYSSGYYSYLWAEVLAVDSFAALKEKGENYIEQIEASDAFKKHILEVGGVHDMSDNFRAFRGREPDVEHLFKSYGIPV